MQSKELKLQKKEMLKIVNKWGFALLLFLSLLSAILFVIAPITLNNVVENVGTIGASDIIKVILLLAAGYLVEFISVFIKNELIQQYHGRAAEILYADVFKLNYDKYIEDGPTAIRDLVWNAADAYAGLYFDVIPSLIVNIATIIVSIYISFTLNHIAALLMFITLPIHYFGFKLLNKKLAKLSVKLRQASSKSQSNIHSVVSQVDFIKQNSENENLLPMIKKNILESEGVRKKVNYVANGVSGLLIGLNQIIQSLTIVFLAALALKNKDAFGGVVYVMLVFPYFSNAIRGLSFTNLGIADVKAADEFLKTMIEYREEDGALDMPSDVKSIRFDINSVDIYDKNLLNDIHMSFKKGDIVGIKGESGTGKSTLVKLIPKFRSVKGIYINDIPIEKIKNEEYLKNISYYSQNTPIISDTIYNNLNFGRKPVQKSVYENLKFLSKFNNLDEMIIENGANLSGGDKQRIALSRYFVENAQIVILDEPTSSLDKETETEIMTAVLENNKDKIIFIISHNNDIMNYCNYIVEVKNKTVDVTKNDKKNF
ncbi:ABC-type multidrug transport system fused ATPase/permease subunit [Ezakiella coagulans]|uniref:ABC-type multidrug transport system fused ATPase/permease subunit n=1 Tax=Ezakiella coagulans TaxID=46507 RepID=A0A2U1E5T3_9FIRM|nr:ABC transporter ATP-binding protein [Ezakiella coagulans]PVY95306.1 ABC-type multidrug transport system fused ATPase/permease subunit [Ezakiella coagulans]